MASPIISKESILKVAKEIVSTEGLNALNIRKVARESGIAIGSVYYYFPSKDDLLIDVIEGVWEDIFKLDYAGCEENSFVEYIERIFNHTAEGIKKYPNFFTIHSLSFKAQNMNKAKGSMRKYLEKFKANLKISIDRDANVNQNAFDADFTKDKLVQFIISGLLSLVIQKNYDTMTLINMIKKSCKRKRHCHWFGVLLLSV